MSIQARDLQVAISACIRGRGRKYKPLKTVTLTLMRSSSTREAAVRDVEFAAYGGLHAYATSFPWSATFSVLSLCIGFIDRKATT